MVYKISAWISSTHLPRKPYKYASSNIIKFILLIVWLLRFFLQDFSRFAGFPPHQQEKHHHKQMIQSDLFIP